MSFLDNTTTIETIELNLSPIFSVKIATKIVRHNILESYRSMRRTFTTLNLQATLNTQATLNLQASNPAQDQTRDARAMAGLPPEPVSHQIAE